MCTKVHASNVVRGIAWEDCIFLQKVTHAVCALDKPMHLYVIGHSSKMVATLDFVF